MKFKIFSFCSVAVAGALLVSCGSGSSGESNNVSNAPDDTVGPASTAAFENTTIKFNPTIQFLPDGELRYSNIEDNTNFVSTLDGANRDVPRAGNYTYTPASDLKSGSLTISLFDPETEDLPVFYTATLSNFNIQNAEVKTFTTVFAREGTFDTLVEAGSLDASKPKSGDEIDIPSGAEDFTFQANGNIATGTTFTKKFLAVSEQVGDRSGSPLPIFLAGDVAGFEILPNGALDFEGLEIPFVSTDGDGTLFYSGPTFDNATLSATFQTGATSALSDLTITWTEGDTNSPGEFNRESITFAN